jgi:putative addiction module component (TIGR02574 family)
MTAKALLEKARSLPKAERLSLVQDLWDSIAEEPDDIELTDAERQLLDQRIASYEANPTAVLSWDQVKAEARRHVTQQQQKKTATTKKKNKK